MAHPGFVSCGRGGGTNSNEEAKSLVFTNTLSYAYSEVVFWILTRKYLGLPDPDPLIRGMDPDPSIIKQKKKKKP
jgi:hypothetical protein